MANSSCEQRKNCCIIKEVRFRCLSSFSCVSNVSQCAYDFLPSWTADFYLIQNRSVQLTSTSAFIECTCKKTKATKTNKTLFNVQVYSIWVVNWPEQAAHTCAPKGDTTYAHLHHLKPAHTKKKKIVFNTQAGKTFIPGGCLHPKNCLNFRADIKGRGPGIFPSYFEVYPRQLCYKTSMLTSPPQLESPAIFRISPSTSKIYDSPEISSLWIFKSELLLAHHGYKVLSM